VVVASRGHGTPRFLRRLRRRRAPPAEQLSSDPFSGTAYAFRNRRGTAVKILVYDAQGFWLCHERSECRAGEALGAWAPFGDVDGAPETRAASAHGWQEV
jgi:hypothetical protein